MSKYLKPLYALPVTAILLAAILLSGVISHMATLNSGREVTIPARGYDPRDVMLGHYVRIQPDLNSELSREASAELATDFGLDSTVGNRLLHGWVLLEPTADGWVIVKAGKERPDANTQTGQVALFAELNISDWGQDVDERKFSIQPRFDFTRFYANKSEALRIEKAIRNREDDVKLILSVTKDGKAHLKGVDVNGERTVISWW